VRANLVKQDTLHQLAARARFAGGDPLGEGECARAATSARRSWPTAWRPSSAPCYLDAGYVAAQALVHRLFKAVEINPTDGGDRQGPKTELQEWLQGRKMKPAGVPGGGNAGAAHKQSFDVECEIAELWGRRARHWRLAPCRRAGSRRRHACRYFAEGHK
jgi:ribonuclease-3